MKHYKSQVNKAVANIETLIMSLMKVNFYLKNSCQDCPDQTHNEGEGKQKRRRKNKKTTVSKAEKSSEPKKPGRPPMRRVVGQAK